MKKNVIKTAFATVCVVAAGMGGLKAYNFANRSQANMLLAENIDAFSTESDGDYGDTEDCEDCKKQYSDWQGWCKNHGCKEEPEYSDDVCVVDHAQHNDRSQQTTCNGFYKE